VIAGLGRDDVRFAAPIRAGDELSVWRECIETRVSRTKPGRGVVKNRIIVGNQHANTVLTFVDAVLVRRRRIVT
jgi:acyl dehydratase